MKSINFNSYEIRELIKLYKEQKVLRIKLMDAFNGEAADIAQSNLTALHVKLHKHLAKKGFGTKETTIAYNEAYTTEDKVIV